jgi:hypothetical protein
MKINVKKLLVVEEGRQAYYADVVRYKNPYTEDLDESKWWFTGWNDACQSHDSFAELMLLKGSNEELKEENKELKEKNQELFIERVEVLEEGMFLLDDLSILRAGIVEISTLLDETISYLDQSSVLSFRREKMTTHLENLRLKVKKHNKSVSPEGVKNKPK